MFLKYQLVKQLSRYSECIWFPSYTTTTKTKQKCQQWKWQNKQLASGGTNALIPSVMRWRKVMMDSSIYLIYFEKENRWLLQMPDSLFSASQKSTRYLQASSIIMTHYLIQYWLKMFIISYSSIRSHDDDVAVFAADLHQAWLLWVG